MGGPFFFATVQRLTICKFLYAKLFKNEERKNIMLCCKEC